MTTILHNNIRKHRNKARLSLDELAFHSGMSARKLSVMERGLVRVLKSDDLQRIAQVLEVPVDELYIKEEEDGDA